MTLLGASILCLSQRVRKEILFNEVYMRLSSIASWGRGRGIEFKVITTFSSVRRPSKCTYCPLQGLAYNSMSLKNASAFCFRMESLESWAGGFISSHTQTQAKKLMLFTSVL